MRGRRVVDLTRRDRQQGPAPADSVGEPLRAAPCRHDAQRHLVEADLDVVGGDTNVSGDGDLGSAAECVSVEGRDDRKREPRNAVEELAHAGRHVDGRLVGANRRELLQVAAGDERALSPTAQHHDRGVGIQDAVERRAELVDGRETDGVADVGPVDRHHGDAGVDLDAHTAGSRRLIGFEHLDPPAPSDPIGPSM